MIINMIWWWSMNKWKEKAKSFKSKVSHYFLPAIILFTGRDFLAFCHIWKNERIIGQGRDSKQIVQKPNFAVERVCIIDWKVIVIFFVCVNHLKETLKVKMMIKMIKNEQNKNCCSFIIHRQW